jgi:flagellar hook-length control protein FliK
MAADAAVPEVPIDPALVDAGQVAALTAPAVPVPVPIAATPVTSPVERATTSQPMPTVAAAPMLRGSVDFHPDAPPVPRLEAVAETGATPVRADMEDAAFSRQLAVSSGGEAAAHARTAVERVEPMPESGRAAVAPTPVPIDTAAQNVVAVAPRREPGVAAPLKVDVAQPLAAPGWRDAFADRVAWVVNAKHPSAEMQLNPPNLGPVEIRVNVTSDQASLSFFSPHAAVRDAIQAALPRLTDAFAASGLTLGNVFVGAESQSGQHPAQGDNGPRYFGRSGEDFAATEPVQQVTWLRPGVGLGRVDLFA